MQSIPSPINAPTTTVTQADLVSNNGLFATADPIAATIVEENGIVESVDAVVVDERRFARRIWDVVCSVAEWLFGLASLLVALALLAPVPILQFLSLGYFL